jgi:acyl-CoA synthetase (AMP-forming)/AMP-acid ligase II
VVPRRRDPDPRGLRPHRDVGRGIRQPARQLQARLRGHSVPRQRGEDRRGRRGPHQGPAHHEGLPQPRYRERVVADAGRLGRIDEDGFLFITGRKKELFKTSGGKYVAPPHIEGTFKGISALTSQILVHGNDRNFCSALITLDPDGVAEWAAAHGMAGKSYAEVVASPEIHDLVAGQIEELNSKLNRWETIKKFAILDHDLTVENGEITPSMKVKRNVVEANNKAILDGFYA